MKANDLINIKTGQFAGGVNNFDGKEMGGLGQSINNYLNSILTRIGPGQSGDKIHGYMLPLPF